MIVWLASYPRSGNTFFRALLNTVYNLPSLSVYDEKDEPLDQSMIGNVATETPLEELRLSQELYFRKTHGLPEEDNDPAIYLVRDGRDVLVSYARYAVYERQDISEEQKVILYMRTLRQMIVTNDYFGGWSQNVEAWMNRKAPTAIVRFEDLISSPVPTLEKACNELGLNMPKTNGAPPSFEELHEKMPKFFRRGKIGSWHDEMPDNHLQLFWERHGATMKLLGYGDEVNPARTT